MSKTFHHIYGPVYSWRLGYSLGIDPLSRSKKICNMDCIYCQLGVTSQLENHRYSHVSVNEIIEELHKVHLHAIDYITFSGRGEPTLAANLGEMIDAVKVSYKKNVAVITNSAMIYMDDVQQDLAKADFVLAKLDAGTQKDFDYINGNWKISFEKIVQGLKIFRQHYKGKFALQIMLMPQNIDKVKDIADVARNINPDEIELNTPLRACAIKPMDSAQMQEAEKFFSGMHVITVFGSCPQNVQAIDEKATANRHGKTRKQD